jgi:hypothetical protein
MLGISTVGADHFSAMKNGGWYCPELCDHLCSDKTNLKGEPCVNLFHARKDGWLFTNEFDSQCSGFGGG